MRILKSVDFTKPPKRKKKFIITDKEEYNKRLSVGFSNLSPAVRFLFESGALAFRPSAIEKASRCIVKARYDFPKKYHYETGGIKKIYLDFNRINRNTRDVEYGNVSNGRTRIKYSCRKKCNYEYGLINPNEVKWRAKKKITFLIRDSDNMLNRVSNALRDISKVCNKSTTKY